MRTCKVCKERYEATKPFQQACSIICAITLGRAKATKAAAKKAKEERKTDRARKVKLKTRSDYMKDAQREFNKYIRLRDAEEGCISCGRHHQGQWHAGHYLSVGARPEHRFDEDNVHKQCQPCNTHLHGNIAMYRSRLVELRGGGVVARLEGPSKPRHYSIEDLKQIIATYKAKTKELTRES